MKYAPKAVRTQITQIVKRARDFRKEQGMGVPQDYVMQRVMSVEACHMNSVTLDLDKLESFDGVNLLHDVEGIHRHVCKTEGPDEGKLQDFFLPRCAAAKKAA